MYKLFVITLILSNHFLRVNFAKSVKKLKTVAETISAEEYDKYFQHVVSFTAQHQLGQWSPLSQRFQNSIHEIKEKGSQ